MTAQFLTETELAERWNVSLSSLQKYRSKGRAGPPYVVIGPSTIRYNLETIMEYEQGREMGGYISPQTRRALLRHADIFTTLLAGNMNDKARAVIVAARDEALRIANSEKTTQAA